MRGRSRFSKREHGEKRDRRSEVRGQRTDDRNQSVKKKEEMDSPVGAAFSRDLALLTISMPSVVN